MRKIELKATIKEGKLLLDAAKFTNLVALLDDGDAKITVELLPDPKTIEEFRAWYFAMRDIVAEETGNTKESIHQGAKEQLLDGHSTKVLDELSWRGFIIRFKSWAFEHFNVYL